MKTISGIKLSSPEWLLKNSGWGRDPQHIYESLYTLSNGYMGARGIYEEHPPGVLQGNFISDVYDCAGAQTEELSVLPNPVHFFFTSNGEKLDVRFMGYKENERVFDMKTASLHRKTLFEDGVGHKFEYTSARFLSMEDPHLACFRVSLKLLNGRAAMTALDYMAEPTNTGGLIYGVRKQYRLMDFESNEHINLYGYKTQTYGTRIVYADALQVSFSGNKEFLEDRMYNFTLSRGETITFTKYFSVYSAHEPGKAVLLNGKAKNALMAAMKKGFIKCFEGHAKYWVRLWDNSNIKIDGDKISDKALRFNIYHLLAGGNINNRLGNVGARALTGQGYRGHVFWDSDIFMHPFYIHNDPEFAKKMILYRYERLDKARENARSKGYAGAHFPWESGLFGEDITPRLGRDIDGTFIKIDTMDYEVHITADVAYAVNNYIKATGDIKILTDYAAELVFETARFWVSRLKHDQDENIYTLEGVTGPDEFHVGVNNNVFTNGMVKWHLRYACSLYDMLRSKYETKLDKIITKIELNDSEISLWDEISSRIYMPAPDRDGIIEQFDGYFKKKNLSIKSYNRFFMPNAPKLDSYVSYNKYQFLKQADLVLLFHMLPEYYNYELKKKNYDYYVGKTIHQSSLSHSTYAMIGTRFGDILRSYAFFLVAAQVDLLNLHRNTDAGIHMANSGGVWQSVVFGFSGIEVTDNMISIDPALPGHWRSISLKIHFKGNILDLKISHKKIRVESQNLVKKGGFMVKLRSNVYKAENNKKIMLEEKIKEKYKMKRVKDILKTDNCYTVTGDESVKKISKVLNDKQVSGVVVCSDSGELEGIVTKKDIIKYASEEGFSELKASDIMNKDVMSIKLNDHIEIALRVFTDYDFSLIPILDKNKVAGVLFKKDVLTETLGHYY